MKLCISTIGTASGSRHRRPATLGVVLLVTLLGGLPGGASSQQAPRAADSVTRWSDDGRLVYSASRYAQRVSEAPASVTLISSQEIRDYGYRTLADILSAARGIFTRYDRNYAYVTVRGISRQSDFNTRILVLVDGHRINDAATDAAGIGTDGLIDVDLIDHVEIIHGPGSALYGTSAFFGVVNLVTIRGRTINGLQASAEMGSFETSRAAIAWGRRFAPSRELLLGASTDRRGGRDLYYGEFDDPSLNGGVARGADGEHANRAFAKGMLGDLTVTVAYSLRFRHIPTAPYGTVFNDSRTATEDRSVSAVALYEHAFADLSRTRLTASYDEYAYDGTFAYEDGVFRDFNDADTWSLEGQYLRTFGAGHTMTVGTRLRWVSDAKIGAYTVGTPEIPLDIKPSISTSGEYAQFAWQLGPRAILYTGVRHDLYDDYGGTVNPRASLVLQPFQGTTLKAHFGQAFRAPNLYERMYSDGGLTQKQAAHLRPERVHTSEVSIEQFLRRDLRFSVSAYRVHTRDLINLVTDPADGLLVYDNEDAPMSRGIETELEGNLNGVEGRVAYAHQHVEDGGHGSPVDSPKHILRAGVSVPLSASGRLAIEVRHLSTRQTLAGDPAPSYTLANLTLSVRSPASHVEFFGAVRNLFNAAYGDPGGEEHVQNLIPQDGRSTRAGVKVRF